MALSNLRFNSWLIEQTISGQINRLGALDAKLSNTEIWTNKNRNFKYYKKNCPTSKTFSTK
jgi:hypothetical protein